MTTRRVNVTLTIPTDLDETDVLTRVLSACGFGVESAIVHAFDLDDADEPEQTVCLVLSDAAIHWAVPEAAETVGKAVNGVVVELPITADYRKDGTDA